jgi:dual specificity phosphatase 12
MKNKNRCGGICGVAVGMGVLGDEEDLARIKAFLTTLSPTRSIPVESIQPCYPLYASIQDELDAFRDLDADAKVEATRLQVMGPGRMAKFVTTFASKVFEHALREEDGQDPKKTDWVEKDIEAVDGEEDKTATADSSLEGNPSDVIFAAPPRVMDPDKMRYSCRTCRTILFGHDDLEDPPHVASRHHFSRRKATHGLGGTAASSCESYFLQTSLPRMGSGEIDGGQNEGKFSCSHCGTKLGTYNWSGAQCSCGTWVVPAIQIPKSRVDAIVPANQQQFTAPIITPLILQPAAATVVNAAGPGPAACD